MQPPVQTPDIELLERAKQATGCRSDAAFARDYLVRDARTIRKWREMGRIPARVVRLKLLELAARRQRRRAT